MSTIELKPRDFKSDQEVRWCPGCGDYAILNSTQAVLAQTGIPREKIVVVSGIGCSSRFPYYMGTYGFHGIHGRALSIATGIKTSNPDLTVWVATGDGDAMSIGGNHLIHTLRRNVDLKILMFNNQIYGLTKGQYSPTSPQGLKTKTTPYGSVDMPFHPIELALGAGATFVARCMDTRPKHMKEILTAAANHKGTAFVEIWQNCLIFNDGAWRDWSMKDVRDEHTVELTPGQPLLFGKEQDKGLKMECCKSEVVSPDEATIWDPTSESTVPAYLMAHLDHEDDRPRALGIFRDVQKPTYDEQVNAQVADVIEKHGAQTMHDLIFTEDAWTVE